MEGIAPSPARVFTDRIPRGTIMTSLLLVIVAFLVIYPLVLVVLNSFQVSKPGQPAVYGLEGWQSFTKPVVREAVFNTFRLVATREAIGLVLAILLAWLIARTDLPGKNFFEFMFWLPFFLPILPVTLGWILLLDGHYGLLNQLLLRLPFIKAAPFDIYSFWGIIWVHLTSYTVAVKVMLLTPAFRNMDAALEETARISGSGPLGTLARITVPVMMPAVTTIAILGLIRSLEAFEVELVLGIPARIYVYSTMIYDLVRWEPPNYPPAMALSVLFLAILSVVIILQRGYVGRRQYRTITGSGFRTQPTPLGRWKWPAFVGTLLMVVSMTIIPVAFLFLGTFMKLFGFFNIKDVWTLKHWQVVLTDPIFLQSIRNTALLAFGSVIVCILLSFLVAYVVVRSGFRARGLLDFLAWLPWSIPGILLGIALLWMFLGTPYLVPLYGTIFILIIAIVIKELPVGSQLLKSTMLQLGRELEDVSRISGASWLHTTTRIMVPILLPTIMAVSLVILIVAVRETSAVILLSSSSTRPLSVLMLDFLVESAQMEKAAVVGAVMTVMVTGIALLARAVGFRLGPAT